MNWFADDKIIIAIGKYEISKLNFGEHGIGEH